MKIASAAAIVLISLLVSLLACEVVVRLMDGMPLWPPQDMVALKASVLNLSVSAEYDPLLGWRQRSNLLWPDYAAFGELGIRMNRNEITPLPSRAVLVVGDSFTEGSEVLDHETYPAELERLLRYPVINTGVGGYGTDQMILMAESLMPTLQPSALVIGILDDDINRTGLRVYSGVPKPWFSVRDGTLVHHNNPVPPHHVRDSSLPLRWLAYSYLAAWTAERTGHHDIFRPKDYVVVDNDPVAVTCGLLRRMKQTTDTKGLPLYVVMLYAGSDRLATTMNVPSEKARPISVSACAKQLGIATIDLLPDLVELAKREMASYRALYHLHGPREDIYGHMTVAGNAFVAQAIARRMTADGTAERLRR
jgi:hypothetical protein